ncbi:MAG TPA: cytochrome c maturation protein CcmE, partial [Bacteroidota bacterium]|nr:cytochrome c maturation protein CcmE [Bacteroidota bacterium]
MKMKIIVASVVIVAAIIFGAISFVQTNVEYTDFNTAVHTHKKVQVKGEWIKDKESGFDASTSQFSFYMKDDNGQEERVVFDGAKPNN